jgi:hypothetical protein
MQKKKKNHQIDRRKKNRIDVNIVNSDPKDDAVDDNPGHLAEPVK